MDPPRVTVFSTPLIATWVLDETHRILFDAGDGAASMLEGKIHKADFVALTHAHRDHIAGLPQLLNLRGGVAAANGSPLCVLYPESSGSLAAFGRFLAQFDPMTAGRTHWRPMQPDERIEMEGGRFLRAYATHHIPCSEPEFSRSLGYQVGRVVDRLKPELRGKPQGEIDRLRAELGRDGIVTQEEELLFTISGDTLPMPAETLRGTKFLLHECTFLDADEDRCAEARDRGHEHSCLSEVLDLAQAARVPHLALYHISKRYTDEEILRAVRAGCTRRDLNARVSVALPGRICTDLFSQTIWPARN